MKHIDVGAICSDPHRRLAFLEQYVGFTDGDWDTIRDSVPVLAPHLPALLDAIYHHLLSFDDTRRLFLGDRGEIDPRYIEIRKEHITEWLLKTAGAASARAEFARYVVQIGRRHTGVDGEPGRVVPPRYMVGLMGFLQASLWSLLFDALPADTGAVRRIGLAWSKMLIIQLELLLLAIAPHFPTWDHPAEEGAKA